jgi:two-component system nitrate/nitrite response regulator NarL
MRLLLCDRHSVFAESLALVLSAAGHEIVAVTATSDEALSALRRLPVDVCVLSVGATAAATLARLPEFRLAAPATAMVLLCTHADRSVRDAAAAHGVAGFAYKDGSVADFIAAIARVQRRRLADPRTLHRERARWYPPQSEARRLAALFTPREREVLGRLVHGEDTHDVATRIGVSPATARSHIQSVLKKLGVHSRVEATAAAIRHGLVNGETGEWLLH